MKKGRPRAPTRCHNERVTGSLPRPKRRTRLARAGAIYILVIVAVGLAAGGRPNNLLVWVFAAMLAGVPGVLLIPFVSGKRVAADC